MAKDPEGKRKGALEEAMEELGESSRAARERRARELKEKVAKAREEKKEKAATRIQAAARGRQERKETKILKSQVLAGKREGGKKRAGRLAEDIAKARAARTAAAANSLYSTYSKTRTLTPGAIEVFLRDSLKDTQAELASRGVDVGQLSSKNIEALAKTPEVQRELESKLKEAQKSKTSKKRWRALAGVAVIGAAVAVTALSAGMIPAAPIIIGHALAHGTGFATLFPVTTALSGLATAAATAIGYKTAKAPKKSKQKDAELKAALEGVVTTLGDNVEASIREQAATKIQKAYRKSKMEKAIRGHLDISEDLRGAERGFPPASSYAARERGRRSSTSSRGSGRSGSASG